MMKMMILAPRRAGMTHAQFRRYVTEVHGPLVAGIPEVASAIRHYHYNFPIDGAEDVAFGHPLASHLDIVTQGWFDSREAQLENMAQPRYLEIIRPDEHRFADGQRAVMHYTTEIPVVGDEATGTKVFYFRRRRAGLSRDEFQRAWRTEFADTLVSNNAFGGAVARYVQNHAMGESRHPDGTSTKFYDVIDELSIRSAGALGLLANDARAIAATQAMEHRLLDRERTLALVTETVVNIP
jgi:hypothetical protein